MLSTAEANYLTMLQQGSFWLVGSIWLVSLVWSVLPLGMTFPPLYFWLGFLPHLLLA